MKLFATVLGRLLGDNRALTNKEGLAMPSSFLLNSDLDTMAVWACAVLSRLLEALALGIWGRENTLQMRIPAIGG